MQTEIVIAGFGGQGVLFAGQVLAYTAMDAGKEVTWMPSYGPEMRGGTANCTVIISDEEIGSPLVRNPRAVISMNLPSLDKYERLLVPEGIMVVNASLVNRQVERTDIDSVYLPANELAEELGDKRMTNMIMVGALLAKLTILDIEGVEKSLERHLPQKHKKFLPLNLKALHVGLDFVMKERFDVLE